GGPRLRHEALGPVALQRLDPAERRRLFAEAARWLLARGADDAALAHAWRGAGDDAAAWRHGLLAGRRAVTEADGRRAVLSRGEPLARRGARVPAAERVAALRLYADACRIGDRNALALGALEEALALIPPTDAPEQARLVARAIHAACLARENV